MGTHATDLHEARSAIERSLELVEQVELRLKTAGDRLHQALKESDGSDPRELVYQLRRCSIPGAAELVDAAAALKRAARHAEAALVAAAAAERDTAPGVEARRRAEEVG